MDTSTDTTYNGWTNRETWLYNLWNGDSIFPEDYEDINAADLAVALKAETYDVINEYPQYVVDSLNSEGENFWQDLAPSDDQTLTGAIKALSKINWFEIAEHIAD